MKRFAGIEGRNLRPTKSHRPALWECMLGTVYAMNAKGEVRYFDYKVGEAIAFAGIKDADDVRVYKVKELVETDGEPEHSLRNQTAVWVK